MGASTSGLLDEAKSTHIKEIVTSEFQSFGVTYRQQYSAAYFTHLHQEVEPKREERGLLLKHGPQYTPDEVLYQDCVMVSCWDDQGKKFRERYIVLRRDYKVEMYENSETFSRGVAAKLVLQTAGGSVFTTEEESRAHLEKTCAGILTDVKADSSSLVPSPDAFAVYLHLLYGGHTCFLFQQEDKRDHFLSALKTCIRHCNLDPWSASGYESQAYVQALRLYLQERGCYESWEKLLGPEEKVLASQVMEEVLPWLQSQLQSRVKGKKSERIRQWIATVQATYALVLEQLTVSLEALRAECRHTAAASQALIRSDLDQIVSSLCFLEGKIKASLSVEAEAVCSECVAPYLPSILEALTENISAGIHGMQQALQAQMAPSQPYSNGGTGEAKMALSALHCISLDGCYRQAEHLTDKLQGLKERFGLRNTQKLVHSAHLEMEKLMDSAVYTLELFLQSSSRLQPSQVPVKMERAKERVLKQLDYDSRIVQRRLYEEALLEITLPALTRRMDSKWKTELQQFEQYIFSDYSSFILVLNVYDSVLRNILKKEIETVVQEAASQRSSSLLLDASELALSQYSLLGQTPPRSAPPSPATSARDACSTTISISTKPAAAAGLPQGEASNCGERLAFQTPVIVVTEQLHLPASEEQVSNETTPVEPTSTSGSASECAPVAPESPSHSQSSTPPFPDSLGLSSSTQPSTLQCTTALSQADPPAAAETSATPTASAVLITISATPADSAAPETSATLTASERPETSTTPEISVHSTASKTPGNSLTPETSPTITAFTTPAISATPEISVHPTASLTPTASTENETSATPETSLTPTASTAFENLATPVASASQEASATPETSSITETSTTPAALATPEITPTPETFAKSGTRAPPELSASDEVMEATVSMEPLGPSSSDTDYPMRINLGSLTQAIGGTSALPPPAQVPTDRAIYLTGHVRDSWEVERVRVDKPKEAAEERQLKGTGEEKRVEEAKEREQPGGEATVGGEDQTGDVTPTGGDGCLGSETPPEDATRQRDPENEVGDDMTSSKIEVNKEMELESGADAGKGKNEEEVEVVLHPPMSEEHQAGGATQWPLGSVAIIRELVTEITEVETVVGPCPDNSDLTP